jgi:hypothetical protein
MAMLMSSSAEYPGCFLTEDQNMKSMIFIAGLMLSTSAAFAGDVTVVNNSGGDFDHIYLTAAGTDGWSADFLKDAPPKSLDKGKSYTLKGVAPGRYDIKLTDDDEPTDECIIQNVAFTGKQVKITKDMYSSCK